MKEFEGFEGPFIVKMEKIELKDFVTGQVYDIIEKPIIEDIGLTLPKDFPKPNK